ncbi:cytochrome P450 [Rhizophagus irregularis]|nr:cytochrome P450 [Rhizophagus irregularis]
MRCAVLRTKIGTIVWVIYKIYIWPIYITPLRKISGPSSENPFYGNLRTFLLEENPDLKWIQKYGNIVKYHGLFNQPTLVIADTKLIQEITLNHVYDYITPPKMLADGIAIAGRGLVFAEGEDHKRQRKMMNPAFTHNNVKVIYTLLFVATLDVIGIVGFNYEFNSLTSPNELAKAYDSVTNVPQPALRFAISLLSYYVPYIRNIPIDMNRKFKSACEVIDRVSKKLIKEKYNKAEKGELKGKDLLSLLININKTLPIEEKMTDEELKYQQDLLREELVKAFPDKSNFNPTFDEINSLEYLSCLVKETLRLNSPVSLTTRTNIKDKVFGDYVIPKDTVIMVAISALHKLPEIWGPTAAEFDPKRWLDPSLTKNVSNLNYLPFLTGTRACIGNKVALTEFKVLLTTRLWVTRGF